MIPAYKLKALRFVRQIPHPIDNCGQYDIVNIHCAECYMLCKTEIRIYPDANQDFINANRVAIKQNGGIRITENLK